MHQTTGEPGGRKTGPAAPRNRWGGNRRAWAVGALAGYLGLAVALFAPAWRAPTGRLIGVGSDPSLFAWFLRWTPYALGQGLDPLVSHHLNHPAGVNLMWNTSMLLPGALLAPVTVTAGPVVAYNLLATLALAVSAWAAYLLIARWVAHPAAAVTGGLLYGFSPTMVTQSLGHPHLTLAAFPPLLVLLLDQAVVRQDRSPVRTGLLLGLLVAAQLLTGEELVALSAVAAAVGLVLLAALHRRELTRPRLEHAALALGVGAAVAALLVAWPLLVQLTGPQRVHGDIQARGVHVADLYEFVVPGKRLLLAPEAAVRATLRFSGDPLGTDAYLGVPLLVVLVVAAVRLRGRALVRFAALFALAAAVLALGPRLHIGGRATAMPGPWLAVEQVPLFNHMLPNRMTLYLFLAAAVMLAVLVDWLLTAPPRPLALTGLALVAASLVPLVPRVPFPATAARTPSFFASDAVHRVPEGSVALVVPYPRPAAAEGMLWQAVADMRFRMPGGYAVLPGPGGQAGFLPAQTLVGAQLARVERGQAAARAPDPLRARLRAELRARQVQMVIVGPAPNRATLVAFLSDLLGRAPEQVGGVWLWTEVHAA